MSVGSWQQAAPLIIRMFSEIAMLCLECKTSDTDTNTHNSKQLSSYTIMQQSASQASWHS